MKPQTRIVIVFTVLLFALLLPGCFSHGTLARITDTKGEPFAGTRLAVLHLTGQFASDTDIEYSLPAWLVEKTWNVVDIPISLFWDVLYLPYDVYTIDYGQIFSDDPYSCAGDAK